MVLTGCLPVPKGDVSLPPLHLTTDQSGRWQLAGAPLQGLASAFGTPLYAYDEDDLREAATAVLEATGPGRAAFSARALLIGHMLHLMDELGLELALHSTGELEFALRIGFPPDRMILHSLSYSDTLLRLAVESGVGRIVLYDPADVARAERIGRDGEHRLQILLSLETAIGSDRSSGAQAATCGLRPETLHRIIPELLCSSHLELLGYHASLDGAPAAEQAKVLGDLLPIVQDVQPSQRFQPAQLLLSDVLPRAGTGPDPRSHLESLQQSIDAFAAKAGHSSPPLLHVETGRGIAGRAGIALQRILSVQERTEGRRLIVIDSGGAALPPHARAEFTVQPADGTTLAYDIVGSAAGPGDLLASGVLLPPCRPGDLLIAEGVGAYAHSMAGSAGRFGTPPVVFVRSGIARPATRRDVLADWLRLEAGL